MCPYINSVSQGMPVKLKKDNHDHYKGSLHKASVSNMSKKPSNMPERTNKPKRTTKIKVKNDPMIAEATLNPKENKKSEKNKNKFAVVAEKRNCNTLKATDISIPNESKILDLKSTTVPEKNTNKYHAAAVETKSSKEKQNNGCRTKAIFTNEQAQKKLGSSGDSITNTLESKEDVANEKKPKTKSGTKGKSSKLQNEEKVFKYILEEDKKALKVKEKFCGTKRTNHSAYAKRKNSIIYNFDELRMVFDENLTMDEMKERINSILTVTAIVEILTIFILIIVIIAFLPRIPTIVQPRMSVEAKRTSKLKYKMKI